MDKSLEKISKYLSYLLRHKPDSIGLSLDAQGWASIDALIALSRDPPLSRELIAIVVETDDKQRFALDETCSRIRANQGHSLDIDLGLPPVTPPQVLFHGTASRFWSSIQREGLKKGQRHHVHLTASVSVAKAVGERYGKVLLIDIDAIKMHAAGFEFFKTANNVWLVASVPPQFFRLSAY